MDKNTYKDAFLKLRFSDDFEDKAIRAMQTASRKKAKGGRIRKFGYAAVGVAACLTLIFLMAPGLLGRFGATPSPTGEPADTVFCRVILSMNPSVEFGLDEDGLVLDVAGLNEDGAALIAGIDFAGLSLENATIVVVNRLIAENYISASLVHNDILLSVSGASVQPDTLDIMSAIIRSAASQYALSVDAVPTGENELQIVLAGDADPAGAKLPPADAADLSTVLRLVYIFDSQTSVGNIDIYPEGGEKLPNFVDFAGMTVGRATFWAVNVLIEKGYITDKADNARVVFDLPGYGDAPLLKLKELIALMMREAGLSLDAVQTGPGQLSLVPSDTAAPQRAAKYTLLEIYDATVHKSEADITKLQMEVLSMVFTPQEIAFLLTPRYWAVIPNLIGLTEAEAIGLCEQAGLAPVIVKEYGTGLSAEYVGKVIAQDSNAGGTWEVGTRFLVFVMTDEPEPTPKPIIKDILS